MDHLEHLDEFESVFRRAEQDPYQLGTVKFESAVLVSKSEHEAEQWKSILQSMSEPLNQIQSWNTLQITESMSSQEVVERITSLHPGLIIVGRNLSSNTEDLQYSLDTRVATLTQRTPFPVFLMPASNFQMDSVKPIQHVAVITDHLADEQEIIDYGLHFTPSSGQISLCHVEDDKVLNRYLDTFSRIPEINTELVTEKLPQQLIRDVKKYVKSVKTVVQKLHPELKVEVVIDQGHLVSSYQRLLSELAVDLLVMNSHDEDQLAMHGLSSALTIEMQDLPMLLV